MEKSKFDLFRTFELVIDFYFYKHCGLCPFITLLKSTIQMVINYIVNNIVKEYNHECFYKFNFGLVLHEH